MQDCECMDWTLAHEGIYHAVIPIPLGDLLHCITSARHGHFPLRWNSRFLEHKQEKQRAEGQLKKKENVDGEGDSTIRIYSFTNWICPLNICFWNVVFVCVGGFVGM